MKTDHIALDQFKRALEILPNQEGLTLQELNEKVRQIQRECPLVEIHRTEDDFIVLGVKRWTVH